MKSELVERLRKTEDYSLSNLTENKKDQVVAWICSNILPRKMPLYRFSSYRLKHLLQEDTNIYVTNDRFKEIMLLCGFYPVNANDINWFYRISMKSPAIRKHQEEVKSDSRG